MKKIFVVLMLFASVLWGADATNYFGQPVNFTSSFGQLTYYGDCTILDADSAGNFHTKPFYIGDANNIDGLLVTQITVANGYTADTDVDVILHFSTDLVTWTTKNSDTADGDLQLNGLGAGAIVDTLGQYEAANDLLFHGMQWMVIEFNGQNVNNNDADADMVIFWSVALTPDVTGNNNGQPLAIGQVAPYAKTNP